MMDTLLGLGGWGGALAYGWPTPWPFATAGCGQPLWARPMPYAVVPQGMACPSPTVVIVERQGTTSHGKAEEEGPWDDGSCRSAENAEGAFEMAARIARLYEHCCEEDDMDSFSEAMEDPNQLLCALIKMDMLDEEADEDEGGREPGAKAQVG